MRDRTKGLKTPGAGVLVSLCLLLAAATAWSSEKPAAEAGAKVFPLEEVSLQDCPEPARSRLQAGLYARECGNTPLAGITYPAFKSSKPIYGAATFDMSLFDPQAGMRYGWAVDESAGTGTGYDRFYFDLNRDSDLTNDAPVAVMKEPPAGLGQNPASARSEKTVVFEKIQVRLDYGPEGVWTQAVIPRLRHLGDIGNSCLMYFVAPTARKGKIVLGSEEVEVVLGQSFTITGRYDRPMTAVFLTGRNDSVPFLGYWRKVNGTFCKLSPSPAGDKVGIEPYTGPLGTFELDAGGRDAPLSLQFGYLLNRNSIIDLTVCKGEDGRWTVPVGDYRFFNWFLRYGERRIVLRPQDAPAGPETAPPAVFPLRVRAGPPCTFDLSENPQVVFKSPEARERITAGAILKAEAILLLPETGLMIAALDDMTKKTGTIKTPDGKNFDIYEPVAPMVQIVNAAGQTVAEGTMPFG
jgi:hypothetical protein